MCGLTKCGYLAAIFQIKNVLFKKEWYVLFRSSWTFKPPGYAVVLTNIILCHSLCSFGKSLYPKMVKGLFSLLVAIESPSPVHCSLLVETLLSVTRWHHDDAIPTRPLSLHCFPNNKHCAKGSPMAYIVFTYSERTHATSPHSIVFVLPLFSPLISIVTVLSHARAFLLASCHILLLSSCLEVSLSQTGRVELLWVLPAFARCSFGVGSWQAWQPIPTGPLSCDSSLPAGSLKHPFIPPIQMKAWDWLSFFWPICMLLQKQRSPIPPPHSQTDFLNRLGRLTLVASRFWFLVASCWRVFLLFHN